VAVFSKKIYIISKEVTESCKIMGTSVWKQQYWFNDCRPRCITVP